MESKNKVIQKTKILWIVPRNPWPPRCGASLANSSLIIALTSLGWKVELLCAGGHSEEHALIEAQRRLNVTKIDSIPPSFLTRGKLFRNIFFTILQIFNRHIPLTALPFSLGYKKSKIRDIVKTTDAQIIVWDGLHALAALWSHKKIKCCGKRINIYRAHNVESQLWTQYARKANKFARLYLRHQSKVMRKFEQECLDFVNLALPMSDVDEETLKASFSLRNKTQTIPVSIPNQLLNEQVSSLDEDSIVERKLEDTQLRILWLGGIDWWPNNEGLRWFLNFVWPTVSKLRKDIHLEVVGTMTNKLKAPEIHNATFHGFLENYSAILRSADLLVVPILSGSGVRIKAIEAMSHGLPCLGTTTGLSGLPQQGCWIFNHATEWISLLSELTKETCRNNGLIASANINGKQNFDTTSVKFENLIWDLLDSGVDQGN